MRSVRLLLHATPVPPCVLLLVVCLRIALVTLSMAVELEKTMAFCLLQSYLPLFYFGVGGSLADLLNGMSCLLL